MVNSRTLYTKTRILFPAQKHLMNARIAALCVLFEDLRIELAGIAFSQNSIESRNEIASEFDVVGHKFRKQYFLRRSIATLREFEEALRLLYELDEFQTLISDLPDESREHFKCAVEYFTSPATEQYWRKIRNDIGGHFGSKSVYEAIKNLKDDACCLEVRSNSNDSSKAGPVFLFVDQIVRLVLNHSVGLQDEALTEFFCELQIAFPHAINSANVVALILLDRVTK